MSCFTAEIGRSLKAGVNLSCNFSFECRTDIFKFLFNGKGKQSPFRNGLFYDADAFDAAYFPSGWSVAYSALGDGCKIEFPICMQNKLRWYPSVYSKKDEILVPKKRYYKEVCTVWIMKNRC